MEKNNSNFVEKNIYNDIINFKISNIDFMAVSLCFYSYLQNSPYQSEATEFLKITSPYIEKTILSKHNLLQENRKKRANEIFEKFICYVKHHCSSEHNVGFYADKLCITPKYLTTLSKEISGKTAKEWIHLYILLETKTLLENTNLTIKEVSNKMCFENQSHFGKFFKRYIGMSPKEYIETVANR